MGVNKKLKPQNQSHMGEKSKGIRRIQATSKNVIPAKAGIQKFLTLLDSRVRGSDRSMIIRGPLHILVNQGNKLLLILFKKNAIESIIREN